NPPRGPPPARSYNPPPVRNNFQRNNGQRYGKPRTTSQGGNAMAVDAIISGDGQRLSETEISQLIRAKKCFYCKGEGHRAETCWKKHGKPPQKSMVRTGTTEIPKEPDEIAKYLKTNMDSF